MKKTYFALISLVFLSIIFIPVLAVAAGNPTGGLPLVPCNGPDCTICSLFQMIIRIYNFIVWDIATPLATLALIIGAIMLMVSAGNPGISGKGKTILLSAIIGLALVFLSYLIIAFVLQAVGYTNASNWMTLSGNCK